VCAFVAAVTFLQSHCLETIKGYTYRHTNCWKEFMKQAVEMAPSAMIHVSHFINTISGIRKLIWGISRQTDSTAISSVYFPKVGLCNLHRVCASMSVCLCVCVSPPHINLRCYDIHTKFHKDWFKHSEV
jgi:hypothetical protein